MPLLLLCLLFAAPAAWSAEPVDAPAEATIAVTGTIVRFGSGEPLAGFVVSVGGVEAVSDSAGAFVVAPPPGTWPVIVRSPDGLEMRLAEVTAPARVRVTWSEDFAVPAAPREPVAPIEGAAPSPPAEEAPADGALTGVVVSEGDGLPIPGLTVTVLGADLVGTTDGDGRFVLSLPPGTWDVELSSPAFRPLTVEGVQAGGPPLELALQPLRTDEVTVWAPEGTGSVREVMEERREASAVMDILGAENIARTGDSNAAAALQRIPALTLRDGRYAFVRGLGDRYTQTLLNGAPLPSPEPDRRTIPLDLFPAGILESVAVQKTFSPDLPAEFGGGSIQLRTRSFPTSPVQEVRLSGLVRGGTTGMEGLGYAGGPTDFLGIDGGTRALPAEVAGFEGRIVEGNRFNPGGLTSDELEGLGETFPNVWWPDPTRPPPDLGLNVVLGDGFQVAGRPIGVLAALTYGSSWWTDRYAQDLYAVAQGEPYAQNRYDFVDTEHRIRLSGFLELGASPADGHTIESSTLVLRNTEDQARRYEGYYADDATNIRGTRLQWVERMLVVEQLRGAHELASGPRPSELEWRYTFGRATRLEPDRRESRYDEEASTGVWALTRADGEANQRFFSTLLDDTHDAYAAWSVPAAVPWGGELRFKLGAQVTVKDRAVDVRRFTFVNQGDANDPALEGPPESFLDADGISSEGFELQEVTQTTDNYSARQRLYAGFLQLELPATRWLDLMLGLRVEHGRQAITTFELFTTTGEIVESTLVNTDALPAAVVTAHPHEDMNVRFGYGRTVSRPEFRELSPAPFKDVVGGREQFGNPELVRALIDNLDLRWEWFPGAEDVVAASAFFKRFHDPIETVVIAGVDENLSYNNALRATNLGLEFEVKKTLGFIRPELAPMYLAADVALIRSRIELSAEDQGVQTNDVRALQGQSPWVVNVQLGYDNKELRGGYGFNAALLYNVIGPRIVEVGSFGLPDSYEQPFHQLDLVAGTRFPFGLELRAAGRNLIDDRREYTVGDDVYLTRRPGWSAWLEIGWAR